MSVGIVSFSDPMNPHTEDRKCFIITSFDCTFLKYKLHNTILYNWRWI